MAWYGTGEERMRRFAAYRDLEAKYHDALSQAEAAKAEVVRQGETIRTLAKELAALAELIPQPATDSTVSLADAARKSSGLPPGKDPEDTQKSSQAPTAAPEKPFIRRVSGTVAKVPLAEVYAQVAKAGTK